MAFRVELTDLALDDLRTIFKAINASKSEPARAWFDGLEQLTMRLDAFPGRGSPVPEDGRFRQLLYGHKPHTYRVIYKIDEEAMTVTVIHVRHGARSAWLPAVGSAP